jgi:tetratricopeptide (TPR) repeat protein
MVRLRLLSGFALFCVLILPEASAQLSGNVHVYVTFPDDRATQEQLKVELIAGGNQVAQTFTNDHGQAQFLGVAMGNYQVRVSGEGIQETESDIFEVDARKGTQSIFVRVQSNAKSSEAKNAAGPATISAGDLRVPEKASKQFDKATELMSKQEWQKAIDRLNKALALYPNYAQAYTNLGVVYARLGDADKEREALQKAIAANDHFAPAFVNLGQMEMKLHNFPAAEGDLDKATAVDPTDVRTLVLLAQAELLNSHYPEVIATAHKVHAMAHASFARIHYVAARACEKLNQLPQAITELNLFLTEEPSGPLTAAATQELAVLQKGQH